MTWVQGQSGNPEGRRPGSRNRATILAERLLDEEVEAVCRVVIDAAKSGDITAAKVILDRLVPVQRGRTVQFELPPIESAKDIAGALSAIVQAVSLGQLTTEEGAAVAALLEVQRKAIETTSLEDRLTLMEQTLEKVR